MRLFSTNHRRDRGFTLIELLVTISIMSVVVAGLCDVYLAMRNEWQRQTDQASALVATNNACAQLGTYVDAAMDARVCTRFTPGDALVISIPNDKAHGVYVPTTAAGWGYNRGATVVLYLSDISGSYDRNGTILWAGTMSAWGNTPTSSTVTPDPSWSLYPSGDKGRVDPISSINFTVPSGVRYKKVDIAVTSSYRIGGTTAVLSQIRSVCLRSVLYNE